jgi:hypothetical protein
MHECTVEWCAARHRPREKLLHISVFPYQPHMSVKTYGADNAQRNLSSQHQMALQASTVTSGSCHEFGCL